MVHGIQSLVLEILNEGKSLEPINKTYIDLIVKSKNMSPPRKFRSISL